MAWFCSDEFDFKSLGCPNESALMRINVPAWATLPE
jgi:hypothetical protein